MSSDVKQNMGVTEALMEELILPVSEHPYELPVNWVWVKMAQLFTFVGGGTPSKSEPLFWGGAIPWASVKDIKDKYLYETVDSISEEGLKNSSATLSEPDEVLLITRMSPGKSTITKIRTAINQDLKIVRSNLDISPVLIWAFFQSNIKKLESVSSGTTVKGIKIDDLNKIPFPLPPLPEQKRIVDRIESLLGKVNEAKKSIEGTLNFLSQFRQAVLLLATSGQLTAEWRKNHPHLESATGLLKRISERREEIYEQRCQLAKKNGERSPRKPMEYMKIENDEINIPQSWALALPEHICSTDDYAIGIGPFGSNLKASDYTPEGVPLVFVRNIRSGDFAGLNPKYVSHTKAEKLLPHMARSLDLLITKMGEPPGDCEIYPMDRPEAVITSDVIKLRIWENDLVTEYFKHCINSSLIKKQLGLITKGVTLQKLSLERFRSIMIPVPPLEEQKEIVRCIKMLLDHADQIEGLYLETKSRINTITQSILSKAFRGELGTNDPSEESALVLLQQVLAERLEAPKKNKAAKTN